MDLHPDFKDLLVEFDRFGVSYALLGGYAVGYHSRPRATKDLDLLISGLGDNLERVASALMAFGAPEHVVEIVRRLTVSEIAHFGVPPVRVDLLRSADGIDAEGAIMRAQRATLGDLTIPVLAIDDLTANQRAVNRPQDIADLAVLESVRKKSK